MTTTSTHETQVTADPEVPIIRIVRDFDAPREVVFAAHTDPELLVRWMGPAEDRMRIDRHDCRTGGTYRHVYGSGEEEFAFRGSFHEVRPPELIVQTQTFESQPDGVVLERITFTDLGNGRTRVTSATLVESFEGRDAIIASGMETGVREGHHRLDQLLTT